MKGFIQHHAEKVIGYLEGFDRVIFKGLLRPMRCADWMKKWLNEHDVLLKDFAPYMESLTRNVKRFAEDFAQQAGRPYQYMPSASELKVEYARKILERDKIKEGLVCVLSCVEPCQTYEVRGDRKEKKLVLKSAIRQCQFYYFYFMDREFGLMHVRLQSWVPFTIQVCLNGREYLARQLTKRGIQFEQRENCFVDIKDCKRAQDLMKSLETKLWQGTLNKFAKRLNPLLSNKKLNLHGGYYWTIREAEYATDIMFRDQATLKSVYGSFVRHAVDNFSCQDVLRFMGRRVSSRFNGDVTSKIKTRQEGVCLKHRVEENSIKMYDKQGSVLRIETTINNPARFKVWREMNRKGKQTNEWMSMRKGIADISRRVDVSRAANGRYLEALAVIQKSKPVKSVLDPVSRRTTHNNRVFRALRPIAPDDAALLTLVMQGEFRINGFRNRHIREQLFTELPLDPCAERKASARISRKLALLEAHQLIRKVPKTNLYRVTKPGELTMTTALNMRNTNTLKLAA